MQAIVYSAVFAAGFAATLLSDDAAVITNSGSTNTPGFRIVVDRSGSAGYAETPRRGGRRPDAQAEPKNVTVPKDLVTRFYADLDAAKPLTRLPREGCMKSVSFGTTLTIALAGDTTPDLSCGDHGDARLKALIQDVTDIEKLFRDK